MKTQLPSLATLILLQGCANSSLNYTAPQEQDKVMTERIISGSYNEVWKSLVDKLTLHSYAINHIEKDSGLISIDFSTAQPSDYIECGRWTGHFKNLRVDEKYDFPASDSFSYSDNNGYTTHSKKTLTGKANILLTEEKPNRQKMRVTANYHLNGINNANPFIPSQYNRPYTQTWSLDLKTNTIGKNPSGRTTCYANGNLESFILNLVTNKQKGM